MDEEKKKIDEAWKEHAEKEKQDTKGSAGPDQGAEFPQEPDFSFFVTSLAIQASIALGTTPNPVNNQKEENLNHAKLIIDTLGMLKEKTHGNLNTEEDSLIDNLLYELRMQYLIKIKGGKSD